MLVAGNALRSAWQAGLKEGDVFVGDIEEIPTRKEWRQKFVFGVSLDLVYAANAFRR